jgi:hypothetical protein
MRYLAIAIVMMFAPLIAEAIPDQYLPELAKDYGLSRNSRENRTSFRGRPNISNGLARRESEF